MTPFIRSINPSEISSVLKTILFFYLFKKGMSAISTSSHDKTYHNERLKESMENEVVYAKGCSCKPSLHTRSAPLELHLFRSFPLNPLAK